MKIRSKNVYINEELVPRVLTLDEGKIIKIEDYDSDYGIDYKDHYILPGFIDIHTHGYGGHNASRPTEEGLDVWTKSLIHEGVTGVLFTTGTQSYDKNINALKILGNYIDEKKTKGANVLGINVEGNFISKEFRGAQELAQIVTPNKDTFNEYVEVSHNNIKSVICAVELDKDYEFVKNAVSKGVSVSVGHSGATHEDVRRALEFGLTGATHTGNGMRPFHHREPGVLGAAMNLDELYAEVIVDGHHLNFETVNIIGRLKGKDKLVLVTDSSSYKDYEGQEEGYVRTIAADGTIRDENGNLSGSNLKFNDGVNNAMKDARLDFVTVINAATINPAKYIKVDDHKGLIKEGYDADLVVVDQNIQVLDTYVLGEKF